MAARRVIVTARDRRGKALALPQLRATYEDATSARPHPPPLSLEPSRGAASVAEAVGSAKLPLRAQPAAFATLLHGLLAISRHHRHVELRVLTPGDAGSPFEHGVGIFRGRFDRGSIAVWLATVDKRGAGARLPEATPAPGAERIGDLGALATLLDGVPWALAYAGAVYVKDGPETARRVSPPGRFKPAAWSSDGTRLAILGRVEGGESSLWVSHRGSGALAAIALETPGAPTGAAFSPDGAWIAVTMSSGRLAVLPADGHSSTAIALGKFRLVDPAWSPDGELVACISETSDRVRALHLVAIAEHRRGSRIFSALPNGEDLALADPEFSEDGATVYVRGQHEGARLLRIPVAGGAPEVAGPPLVRVEMKGGASRWRMGRLFVAGVGARDTARADAAWIGPADTLSIHGPKGARLAFGAPDLSVVFVKRMTGATYLWRVRAGEKKPRRVRLPFPAWLTVP